MAAFPIQVNCVIARRDKTEDPYPATVLGWVSIPGYKPGGGPIIPPDEIDEIPPVEPPLQIWGGANEPFPTPPIYFPPDLPPITPPNPIPPPHEGWNYYPPKNGWYLIVVPGEGEAQPKR